MLMLHAFYRPSVAILIHARKWQHQQWRWWQPTSTYCCNTLYKLYKVDFSFDFHNHTLSGNSCSCALPKDDCIFVYYIILTFGSTLVCPTERFHGNAMAFAYLLQRKLNSVGRRKMKIHVLVQCAQPASMSRVSHE